MSTLKEKWLELPTPNMACIDPQVKRSRSHS